MKKLIAAISGVPNPPFLIIAPNGAPIKNSIKQAIERTIFLCHSILCFLNIFSLSRIVISLAEIAELKELD